MMMLSTYFMCSWISNW